MFGNFGKMALIRSIIKTRSMEGSEHGNSSGILGEAARSFKAVCSTW